MLLQTLRNWSMQCDKTNMLSVRTRGEEIVFHFPYSANETEDACVSEQVRRCIGFRVIERLPCENVPDSF